MKYEYPLFRQQNAASALPIIVSINVAAAPCGGLLKRGFDVVLALCALVILTPFLILIAVATRLSDGGPAFYGHTRVGYGGKIFRCWKFRSMVCNSDELLTRYLLENSEAVEDWQSCRKLKRDPRITPLGRVLRKYSIDELPQLFNILVGEMSFVGPRPVVPAELSKYGRSLRHYLGARPGLTGLWQVSGRSDVSYPERVAFDRLYLMNWTFLLDVMLIVKTVPVAFRGRGSY